MNVEFCQKHFLLHLLKWSCDFILCFNVVYPIDWVADIESSLHSCNKSRWVLLCTILFSILLNSVLLVFCWGFLYIYIHQRYWPVILLFFCSVFISEKEMTTHSSTLAWTIPWTEEPGRLQSMGSLRVGHDWTTSLSLFTFTHWRRKW